MSLMRYEPMGLLEQLRREMERMYGDRGSSDEANIATASDWVPAVDIKEEKECFIIKADLPGIDPKDIEIHAEGGMLTIRGERESEKKENRSGYKRIERTYGSFFRRFTLPDTADTDKITAKGNNGVLEIRVPKQEKVMPRKIAVEG
jgi:HSP20 family protein